MNQRKDRVINIRKVIEYILHHYVFVIVCLVCGAIGLAGLCYLKNQRAAGNANSNADLNMETVYMGFTSEEKADVDYAIYSYERLSEIERYIDESVFMDIDPYSVNQLSFEYKIQLKNDDDITQEEKEDLIKQLGVLYTYYVDKGGLATDIIEKKSSDIDVKQEELMEVLFVGYKSEIDSNACFVVGTYVADIMPELNDIIDECMKDYADEISDVAEHELILVDTNQTWVKTDWIYTQQRGIYTERISIAGRLNDALKALSGDTLAYYNAYIEQSEMETEESKDDVETEQISDEQNVHVPFKKLLKYGILGGILGTLGACCLLLLMYMFAKTIVSDADYTLTMGLKYFGKVNKNDMESDLAFIVAKIKLACNKTGISKLALVSSHMDMMNEDIQESLIELLAKQNVELVCVKDILKDCDAMSRLFDLGGCVMIEKQGVSKYNSVYDIVDLCEENNINILGVVDVAK